MMISVNSGVKLAMKRDVETQSLGARSIGSSNGKSMRAAVIDPEAAWAQLVARDKAARFFYAVLTTGVFCRVGCGSRPPLRENVRFFGSMEEAQRAGFRACKKCRPETVRREAAAGALGTAGGAVAWSSPLDAVRRHIEKNVDRGVPLAELGRVAGMSPFTVQRMFKREMGVSPLAYQRALRAASLRGALKEGARVTDAVYEAGFGSPSRAYEGAGLGMTPGRFAAGGKGEKIGFTTARTPFGWMVVGATERGLCWLALGSTSAEAEGTLREEFPLATVRRDASLSTLVDGALESVRDGSDLGRGRGGPGGADGNVGLDLRGTVYQLRVWQALRQIPRGETRSYSELAREMGAPKATRAVARACGLNRVAVVVPCHRVVGANGALTGYRWGVERKKALLEAEQRA